ncbi:MAG: hypothetical protein O9345_16550 [Burkholderiaceae bacterium]|jgi:hypothetical protein|nr:hypothetical protein [Burkholderiales bacterium]MCZ8339736.1 hypothetical protein [Burkholderiaceae bacterium]
MGAADLLGTLRAAGLTVEADDDRLMVAPAEKLTRALRELIRAEKPALLAALAGAQNESGPRPAAARWLLHLPDADPLAVAFDPPATHDEVLARYSGALAAEPVPETLKVELPAAIEKLFVQCVESGLYDEADRAVLQAMHAINPVDARTVIDEMYSRIGRCHRCVHFARPGLSDGYCTRRDDLPAAYGLMRHLPPDGGALCAIFKEMS